MKKLIILFTLLTIIVSNCFSQNTYPPLRLKNNPVTVYGELIVLDSISATFVKVDSLKINEQIIRYATGDTLASLDTVVSLVDQATTITGNDGEILISNGVGWSNILQIQESSVGAVVLNNGNLTFFGGKYDRLIHNTIILKLDAEGKIIN